MLIFFYLLKTIIISLLIIPFITSCNNGCEGMGGGGYNDKPNNYLYLSFKDTSNRFKSVWFSSDNKKYDIDSLSNTYSHLIRLDIGVEPFSFIVIWHKKGIDTIAFELSRSKLKYEIDECNEPYIDLKYNGSFIKKYSFDTVYFENNYLILE